MRLGLTGGLGSGKSSVAAFFRERGWPTLDMDVVVSDFYTQVIQLMPWTNEESIFAEKNWYEVYAYFFEKYIKLKASLVEAIDQYYQENMAGYQWLAVHMRGSDKINEQADLNLLNQECHKLVQSYIEQNSALRIFLLTDSSLYLEEFKEKYGGKILYIEAKRSDSDQGVHNSGFSGKEVGESVIMDCYLAARCDFFIGNGGSNVSAAIGSLKSWPAGSYMLLGRDLRSNLSKMLYNW